MLLLPAESKVLFFNFDAFSGVFAGVFNGFLAGVFLTEVLA
jgi:hypothetical protein